MLATNRENMRKLLLCLLAAYAAADTQARQPSSSSINNSNEPNSNSRGPLEVAGQVITGALDAPNVAALRQKEAAVKNMRTYSTRGVTFDCSGMQCGATLYLPKSASSTDSFKKAASKSATTTSSSSLPPVIVMAHGLGGERTWLAKFASVFAENGFAVLAFDYRHWGSSDGQPRQWISISKQHQDWFSAIKHVQTQMASVVDINRLSLWGTSFAGGHVIVVASKLPGQIKAVISNVSLHVDHSVMQVVCKAEQLLLFANCWSLAQQKQHQQPRQQRQQRQR